MRLDMLEEAVEIMRELWTGRRVSFSGDHYDVENARIYTLPERPPDVLVSGFGPKSVELAARIGDGYCITMPDKDLIGQFRSGGGAATSPCTPVRRSATATTRPSGGGRPTASGRTRTCRASSPRCCRSRRTSSRRQSS
jgi:alkanesulfonate monooxygenase SsuD/methylene tetrahydromethanopterin reductase-like flavin-dependent oxidoreductase (luciferase family)